MNHGAPEYHSRGFETHRYVYSRLSAYGHFPPSYITGGAGSLVANMPSHYYKHHHFQHHPLIGHSINGFFYTTPQLFPSSFTHSQSNKKSKDKMKGLILDREIVSFCKSMEPSAQADLEREKVVTRIRKAVESCISPVQVEVFGSFKTGLYLPSSDIDVVVFHECRKTPFDVIKGALVKAQVCDADKILVLYNATVPIIKLTDKQTDVKIDVGFNITNAPKSAIFIQRSLGEWPCLKELLIVLKQLLIEQDLNEVYSGGISSYSLTLLILCFFKIMPRNYTRHSCGTLLMEFLKYYGHHFDYRYFGVCLDPACLFPKSFPSDALVIQDPLCPTNDVARGSYRFSSVQAAFKDAYNALNFTVQSGNCALVSGERSALDSIIRINKSLDLTGSSGHLFYDQPGTNSGFVVFSSSSSDDFATPSSSNIDFEEECDVERAATGLHDIVISPLPQVTLRRNSNSKSVNYSPSSSSSTSEIVTASDDEADCTSGSSDSGISMTKSRRLSMTIDESPDGESFPSTLDPQLPGATIDDALDCSENPFSEADVFNGRCDILKSTSQRQQSHSLESQKPSYRDVLRSTPSRSHCLEISSRDKRQDPSSKSRSCCDVVSSRARQDSTKRNHPPARSSPRKKCREMSS